MQELEFIFNLSDEVVDVLLSIHRSRRTNIQMSFVFFN